jgi:exopolyphosphatase/guanosine-5'-triphosphate,3'-diphosphate pyrophosphatase
MRIVYPFSASMAGVVPNLTWKQASDGLYLEVAAKNADLIGDVPEGRLQQLAKLTGKTLKMAIGK